LRERERMERKGKLGEKDKSLREREDWERKIKLREKEKVWKERESLDLLTVRKNRKILKSIG